MTERYTAEWVEARVTEAGATWLDNHDCSICKAVVGYQFSPDGEVWFAGGCNCSWSPPRPSSFQDVANWLRMQSSDEIRDRLMAGLR